MQNLLTLDGSHGEGGGQIVRTALTLSCITGTPITIERIRAGRKKSGLRPQHVTAIQAAADICGAETEGVAVHSNTITFLPGGPVRAGEYEWAVGTAGSATLVLQTVLLPLALAGGESALRVHGGTHVPKSPSGHYLRDVYTPVLLGLGANVEVYMDCYGWLPEGGGTISAYTTGGAALHGRDMRHRGRIERVIGTAVGCNLPSHIPQRMANRAANLLQAIDAPQDIRPCRTRSVSTGAGIFLAVEYTNGRGGFDVLGRKGMPSEAVAEQAVTALLAFHDSEAAADAHLADQLVIPLALAEDASVLSTAAITPHLRTNIDIVCAFTNRPIRVDEAQRVIYFDDQDNR
ncbi:MAG: RNA 3'-phosphate cyclase [Anaerolineae bacterium]|jgi:RNA 3'-terminal phosphate cyclase (ATP)|nr:RNA 3'-phosphate cyclase [Anaerolineae bacterium]